MSQTLLAWVNLAKLASVSATSAETANPASNTKNDSGAASLGWQTLAGVTTATLTYTLATPGSTVRVIGLFRTNLNAAATITATITYNSGTAWAGVLSGPAMGYGQVVFVLPSNMAADVISIAIANSTNPDGFINVPLVFIGASSIPEWAVSPSLEAAWSPSSNIQTSRGGQKFITAIATPRVVAFDFSAMTDADTYAIAMELSRLEYLGQNVLMIPDIDASTVKYDAVFGIVTASRPVGAIPGASRIRTWGSTIEERW